MERPAGPVSAACVRSGGVVGTGTALRATRLARRTSGRGSLTVDAVVPHRHLRSVAADIMVGTSPPVGHGHNYEDLIPYGWAAVTSPEGWTLTDTQRIAEAVEQLNTADE